MKAFKIQSEKAVEVFQCFLNTKHWEAFDYEHCVHEHKADPDDLIFIIHQDGAWSLRYVGTKYSYSEVDSLAISGYLPKSVGEALIPILKDCERCEQELDRIDVAYSRA